METGDVRIEISAPSRELAEHVVGEVWEAGASGVEERDLAAGDGLPTGAAVEGSGVLLIVYAPAANAERISRASLAVGSGVAVAAPEVIEPVVWSQVWKQGLAPITVSDRLRIRPTFTEAPPLAPSQVELLIDPGQAFGTGGHASTLLALEWVDELARRCDHGRFDAGLRVLDVGTGTGVLALSALALGAGRAVGHDLDPVATCEAAEWARRNGLASCFDVFTGGIEALAGARFDLVVANLLKRELLPIAKAVAEAVRPGGDIVLSGLLRADLAPVEAALGGYGVRLQGTREREVGGDCWVAPWLTA